MVRRRGAWKKDRWSRLDRDDYVLLKTHVENCTCPGKHESVGSVVSTLIQNCDRTQFKPTLEVAAS